MSDDDGFRLTPEFAAMVSVGLAQHDLVTRLRSPDALWAECPRCDCPIDMEDGTALLAEAATEIERLRARVHALELESTGGWEIER